MNVYVKAVRLPFLTGSLIPVILASALGFLHGYFHFLVFVLVLLGVGSLHLGANLINDYYDNPGSDRINLQLTPFSGGSRVIQDKEMTASTVRSMAIGFFVLGIVCGLFLAVSGRPFVLIIGLMGLLAGWVYSAAPFSLMCKGLGEFIIFLAFGPLITWGTYYALSGLLTWEAFSLGFPLGFLITAVIWINQFPDYRADKDTGKHNLVVRLGRMRSRWIYHVLMLSPYAVIVYWTFGGKGAWPYCAVLLTIPLALKAMRILHRHYGTYRMLIPAQALTIRTHLTLGLLFSVSIVFRKVIA